jgi:glycosyltransferase involved in cell wall biosynthesis
MFNLVESVEHLRALDVHVTIFTTDMGGPAASPAVRATFSDFPSAARGCDVRVFEAQTPRRIVYAPKLWRALKMEARNFDLVRVHGLYLYPQLAASSVARQADIPYLVTPHGALDPWLRRRGWLRKGLTNVAWQNNMLRRAAGLHATTVAEQNLLADVVPADIPRYVVGNGLDVSAFRDLPPRGELRKKLGLIGDVPLVLFLGRISEKKGIDILIRAMSRMQLRKAALAVVGPDDEGLTPSLQALARQVGAGDRVFFVGPQFGPQRLAALADADVWALPSHAENFGNAVVEAMAAGVPTVVSTEVNLAPEIRAAGAGRVSACNDVEFARECTAILGAPAERSRLATAGRAFAERYDWSRVARELAGMFAEVSK